jgi:hypothetical protein
LQPLGLAALVDFSDDFLFFPLAPATHGKIKDRTLAGSFLFFFPFLFLFILSWPEKEEPSKAFPPRLPLALSPLFSPAFVSQGKKQREKQKSLEKSTKARRHGRSHHKTPKTAKPCVPPRRGCQ